MAYNYVKDSLPWLVPSAAIAFAAYVFMEGGYGPAAPQQTQAVPVAQPASAAMPETTVMEEEVVARQAAPDTTLVAPATAPLAQPVVAAPEPAPVPVPAPAPEPQPQRTAALATTPNTSFFNSGGFDAGANTQCVEDLKAMAAEARVYFPSGGLTADANGVETGKIMSKVLALCPNVKIRVDGHSDRSGNPASNLILSERRAQEVIRRIGAGGHDTSRFFAQGMGDSQPSGIVGPRPAAYYDRRVEFTIVEDTTRVALRTPAVSASPWANASCVTELARAVESTVLLYAPRSISLRPDDLDIAMNLAELAVKCPHARLRVIGHHAGGVQTGESIQTARIRAKALMSMLVGRGIDSSQIIIAAPSRAVGPSDPSGLPGSRVDFDVILEDS